MSISICVSHAALLISYRARHQLPPSLPGLIMRPPEGPLGHSNTRISSNGSPWLNSVYQSDTKDYRATLYSIFQSAVKTHRAVIMDSDATLFFYVFVNLRFFATLFLIPQRFFFWCHNHFTSLQDQKLSCLNDSHSMFRYSDV